MIIILSIVLCLISSANAQRVFTPTLAVALEPKITQKKLNYHMPAGFGDYSLTAHTLEDEQKWLAALYQALAKDFSGSFNTDRLNSSKSYYLSADYVLDTRYQLSASVLEEPFFDNLHNKLHQSGVTYRVFVEGRLINVGNKEVVASTSVCKWYNDKQVPFQGITDEALTTIAAEFSADFSKRILKLFHQQDVDMQIMLSIEPDFERLNNIHYRPARTYYQSFLYPDKYSFELADTTTMGELGYPAIRFVTKDVEKHGVSYFVYDLYNEDVFYITAVQQLRSNITQELLKRTNCIIVERARLEEAQNEELRSLAALVDRRVAASSLLGNTVATHILVGDLNSGFKLIERVQRRIVAVYVNSNLQSYDDYVLEYESAHKIVKELKRSLTTKEPQIKVSIDLAPLSANSDSMGLVFAHTVLENWIAQALIEREQVQVIEQQGTEELEAEDRRVVSNLVDKSTQYHIYNKSKTDFLIQGHIDPIKSVITVNIIDKYGETISTRVYPYRNFKLACKQVSQSVAKFFNQEQLVYE